MWQKGDSSFAKLLNRVRLGQQTDADIALFKSRTIFPNTGDDYPHEALNIFSTNKECDRHNSMMMECIKGDSHAYRITADNDFATTTKKAMSTSCWLPPQRISAQLNQIINHNNMQSSKATETCNTLVMHAVQSLTFIDLTAHLCTCTASMAANDVH